MACGGTLRHTLGRGFPFSLSIVACRAKLHLRLNEPDGRISRIQFADSAHGSGGEWRGESCGYQQSREDKKGRRIHRDAKISVLDGVFAIVGASNDRNKFGNKVLRPISQQGRRIFPINPAEKTVEGLASYPNLASLPEPVHGVSIVTPPHVTGEILKQAAAAGIGHVWIQPGAEPTAGRPWPTGWEFPRSAAVPARWSKCGATT